ncbi:MAG: MarR family winged helix-turn-helix transcriptional regulator [Lachnospiraceae bacterium]
MFQVNDYFAPLVKMMSEAIERKANAMLKEYDVTSAQIRILSALSMMDNDESTLKELEKIFSFSQAAIAATTARMEAKGLLEGHTAEDDKRIKYVRVTAKGKKYVKVAKERMAEFNEELLEDFSEEERRVLMEGLRKVYKKLI